MKKAKATKTHIIRNNQKYETTSCKRTFLKLEEQGNGEGYPSHWEVLAERHELPESVQDGKRIWRIIRVTERVQWKQCVILLGNFNGPYMPIFNG